MSLTVKKLKVCRLCYHAHPHTKVCPGMGIKLGKLIEWPKEVRHARTIHP